jgi:hypothetical protein
MGAVSRETIVVAVFAAVYLGMLLGRLPRLALDRTGIALLGAIALLATGVTTLGDAGRAVDVPTLALLFGLMVVSAQLRLGGFYGRVASPKARRAPATWRRASIAGRPRRASALRPRCSSSSSRATGRARSQRSQGPPSSS